MSWAYYVMAGDQPDCANDLDECGPVQQKAHTPGIWNPLPYFDTVKRDGELGNIRDLRDFYAAARNGTLPSVVWLAPAGPYSEHPPALVSRGQAYVTGLDQRDHARPGLEEHGDLPDLGRLGRILRSRRAADASTRTATASACRESSSARTRAAASSTTRR